MKKLIATFILIGLLLSYPLVATKETSVEGLGWLSVETAYASPDEVTYYFNTYDTGVEEWTTTPQYAVDNITTNYASTTIDNQVERLTGNTCLGDDLGTITKVEIRAYAYGDGNDELYIRPEFVGKTGSNYITVPTAEGSWGAYRNITSDANAPSPWTWAEVQDLECDIELNDVAAGKVMYVSKVEIRVTYGEAPKGGSVAFVRATEGSIVDTTLTLNIEVSAGSDRVLVVGLAYRDASVLVPTSIVFNGNQDFILEKTAADGGDAQCFLYYLPAPAVATANVVITMPDEVRMVGYIAYFTGVDQSNPFTANTDEAQGITSEAYVYVTSDTDEICIDIMVQVSAGPDTITGNLGTLICDGAATGGGSDTRGGGQYEVGAASRLMYYSLSDSDNWNIIAGALQEPSACAPDISNTPVDIDFGVVNENSTNYSNGSAPSFPLDDGECYFTVTNNSGGAIDITVESDNFTGGVGWVISNSVSENVVVLKVGKSGDEEVSLIILTGAPQGFITGLADSGTMKWELRLETGTFTDGAEKSTIVTLTAVCQ